MSKWEINIGLSFLIAEILFFVVVFGYLFFGNDVEIALKRTWSFKRSDGSELVINGKFLGSERVEGKEYSVFKTVENHYIVTDFAVRPYHDSMSLIREISDGKIIQVWTCKESVDYPDNTPYKFWIRVFKTLAQHDSYFKNLANKFDTAVGRSK